MTKCASWIGSAGLAVLLACNAAGAQSAGNSAPAAASDWANHGGSSDETDFSSLRQIDRSNAARLGLAWSIDLAGEATLEATPLAVGGVLYFTGSYSAVYAVDAKSGKLLWRYDPQIWKFPAKMSCNFGANRGAAYADGRIFAGTLDGRLLALDAKSGRLLWSAETVAPDNCNTITGAPRTFEGKVIIGNAGADFGIRGYVTAYDAVTGRQAWRFYTAPGTPQQNKGDPAMERAAATWRGQYWKVGTGGEVWDSITFDNDLGRIYIGTGNGGPYDPTVRSPGGGDNLYTASIVALDANTGKYIWHYQVNPRDSWDYDSTQQMVLADLVIQGKPRKVLMQAPKNGFFYVIDRTTGKLISAAKITKATWAQSIDVASGRPVEAKNIRYETGQVLIWPSPAGAHSWQSMSFSPATGLAYIPVMQLGAEFKKGPPIPGAANFVGLSLQAVLADADDGKGTLVAWDPVAQQPRWKVPLPKIWNGGTLVTAGGIVFQGTADGLFAAYDASTGKRLWQFNAGLGIIAAPVSYSVDGRQYVSVLVGYGGSAAVWGKVMSAGWKFGAQPRRLLTFELDGKAALPPTPPPDATVHAVDDPSIKIDPMKAQIGSAFAMACAPCHGLNLQAAGSPGPDLRESQAALHEDEVWSIVHDGTLLQEGMPRFPTFTKDQVHDIYEYIRATTRATLQAEKQHVQPANAH